VALRVGFVQTRPIFGKKRHNVERALALMSRCRADLLVLPELFSTGYSFKSRMELRALAEPVGSGDTSLALSDFARRKRTSLIAGIAESSGGRLYNTAVLITPKGEVASYRKTHLFLYEKRLFDRGEAAYEIHRVGELRVGMLICFDWIFPEPFRELALKGVDLVAHPSNLILPYCQNAMVTRALENRIFVVVANRVGTERRRGEPFRFTGGSEVVSPGGMVLARAPKDRESILTVRIDPAEARNKRVTPLNHVLRDRRVDLYREILKGRRR
jgi:predicted amidohydrolase